MTRSSRPLLVLDTNYLCHRAAHTVGHLSNGDMDATGVVFGVLRSVIKMQEEFSTNRVVFCFDSVHSKRQELFDGYKADRRKKYEEEQDEEKLKLFRDLRRQMRDLRREHLPAVGFRNVFVQNGHEADDLIAAIARNAKPDQEIIIVSTDHDLWQLLRPNVWLYNPTTGRGYDHKRFAEEWKMNPEEWASVKALAGCSSDNIPGIPGIGEKTAAAYLRGELNSKSKKFQSIETFDEEEKELFRKLTALPFEGTRVPPVRQDDVTRDAWAQLLQRLGFTSMAAPRVAMF